MDARQQSYDFEEQEFSIVGSIRNYYELPQKGRKTTSSAAYETFDPNNFDEKSKSNSFKTDQDSLGYWLYAMKVIFADLENYKIGCWLHRRNKGQITEIEIKFVELTLPEVHLLTIHIYLSTALLQSKGLCLDNAGINFIHNHPPPRTPGDLQ